MKRLTERNKNRTAMAVCCGENCKLNFCCENGGFVECGDIDDIIDRLAAIEDILGDDYDLDRLRELVEADREGRCYIANVKVGERVFVPDKDGKVVGCRVQGISLPAHGKNLIIHLGGYPAEYLWSDREEIDWWKSREAAERALKGE